MARRYDHSREELNEMAMQAATKIVAEEGLRALSTRRVAKEIGYSVGTIYNLFSNLDDLVLRLNGATLDNLHQALSALGRTGMPEEDLRALAAKYISFTQDNFHLWNSLFEHRLPAGEELPDNFSRKVNRLLALVEEALEPVFGENEQECQKSARVLWSSLHGICSLVTSDKLDVVARETAHELTDSLITHYLAGLKKGE
ncbi:MAG: TetR/AcrR family transcriptional regulator [Sneathiellales bacterium]|nr:TetR/AcrR family transcriptional regulator [Sneathiellales bacterium]